MNIDASVAVGVYGAIAAYAQAVDSGRTDDIADLFCADGVADLGGFGMFEGREAIRAAYTGFVPTRPQLHMVTNTVITSCTEPNATDPNATDPEATDPEATATSDLVVFGHGSSGWGVRFVGRYDDTLHRHDGVWRFRKRVTTFRP